MTEVKLPSLGVAILDARIVSWLKEEGQEVKKDEPIAEVETDKVTFEVVSPINGFLIKKLYHVNDLVKVNETLALVDENQETSVSAEVGQDKNIEKRQNKQKDDQKYIDSSRRKNMTQSTPAAKNLARQNNVDLDKIAGSGPNGLISKNDVLIYLKQATTTNKDTAEEEVIPFDGIRQQIAERLYLSKNDKVQVTTTVEVDVTDTEVIREMIKSELKENYGIRLTLLSFVMKAAIEAIKKYPIINSSLEKDKIIIKKYINFGIAVESEKGLIVPVIHHSDKLTFWQLIEGIDQLIQKSREGKLTPDYIGNGTITISNAGSFGSILSTPIIQDKQSALLWMGKMTKRPVVDENDRIKIRKIMNLCISYDHQVVDGAQVAQFMNEINSWLVNPGKLLISELRKELRK